jgi:hypothetical protein
MFKDFLMGKRITDKQRDIEQHGDYLFLLRHRISHLRELADHLERLNPATSIVPPIAASFSDCRFAEPTAGSACRRRFCC